MVVCRNQEIAGTSSKDKLNEARRLRQQILDTGYTDKLFLEIIKLENWNWFVDYYENPSLELVSQGTLNYWKNIDDKRNDGMSIEQELIDWVEVSWDKTKIKELVMSNKLSIGYSEHTMLEEWWGENNDTNYIDAAIDIGYIPPFNNGGKFEVAIMEQIGFNKDSHNSIKEIMSCPKSSSCNKYFQLHTPSTLMKRYWGLKNRLCDEANSIKQMISYSLGDINLIHTQNQFERLTNSWVDENGEPYKIGEIIVLDIGTNRIPLLNTMTDIQRNNRLSNMRYTQLQCIGYQYVGGVSGSYLYSPETFVSYVEKLLKGVKLIITFNGIRFDGIVLKAHGIDIENKYKHYDIYSAIRMHTHYSLSLKRFCEYNNLSNKNMSKRNELEKAIAAWDDAKLTSALFVLLTCFNLKVSNNANSHGLTTSIKEGIDKVLNNDKNYTDDRKIKIYKFLMKHGCVNQ